MGLLPSSCPSPTPMLCITGPEVVFSWGHKRPVGDESKDISDQRAGFSATNPAEIIILSPDLHYHMPYGKCLASCIKLVNDITYQLARSCSPLGHPCPQPHGANEIQVCELVHSPAQDLTWPGSKGHWSSSGTHGNLSCATPKSGHWSRKFLDTPRKQTYALNLVSLWLKRAACGAGEMA